MGKTGFSYQFSFPIASVWKYVANTDRLNRIVNLPPVKYSHIPRPDGGADRFAEYRAKGMLLRWKENPYEWQEHKFFSIEREYFSGPFRRILFKWEFEETPQGCRIHQSIDYDLKHPFFYPIAYLAVHRDTCNQFIKAYGWIESYLKQVQVAEPILTYPISDPNSGASSAVHPPDQKHFKTLQDRLLKVGIPTATSERLLNFIYFSSEADLVRIRPFRVADKLELSRMDSLLTMLKAVQGGLLSLHWDVLCPSCRGTQTSSDVLFNVDRESHCNACNIKFRTDYSRSIELTFSVLDSIRKVRFFTYCAGGPRTTTHYYFQLRIAAGKSYSLLPDLQSGVYRLRSLQSKTIYQIEVKEINSDSFASPTPPGVTRCFFRREESETLPIELEAGKLTSLEIVNSTDSEMTVVLERTEWLEDVCTAALVSPLPEFRHIFSTQILELGQKIDFSSVAIMFTDLKGSTALYQKMGDARALFVIQKHFEILSDCIKFFEGGIVKTIGDSVMAVFSTPENALLAGMEMQKQLGNQSVMEEVQIRVALHYGPCFLVHLNGVLDFFGSTVNLASRLQGHCEGGDVVISTNMFEDERVQNVMEKNHLTAELGLKTFKGFDQEFQVYRIRMGV